MGWTRVPATPLVKHTLTLADINIKEPGYIFVYLSYESLSNNFVYFDDMKLTHTRSKVIQYNEYYPFGMNTANSWTRENNTGNNFLANSGTELNTTSNLYDLDYRQYDPVLGRLNGIDPMATKYASLSPYNFSFNDPVHFSDPSGADPYMDEKRNKIEKSRDFDLVRHYYNTHGVKGDDDLYGGMFRKAGAGANWAAMEEFRQERGIMKVLREKFKNASFGSGGSNGFWIRIVGVNYSTDGQTFEGSRSTAEVIIRDVFVSNISSAHFKTMLNPVTQAIHEGHRKFMEHPFGAGFMFFVTGGPMAGGGGSLLANLGARQLVTNGTRFVVPRLNNVVTMVGSIARSNFAQSGIRNMVVNSSAQLTAKYFSNEDMGNIDIADIIVAGLSGNSFALNAVGSSLFNLDLYGNASTGFSDPSKGIVDLSTGFVFGYSSTGVASYLGSKGVGSGLIGVTDYTINLWNNAFSNQLAPEPIKH